MERRGVLVMFVMSVIPNPLFDIAGAAAGVVRMPLGRFFLAVLAGRSSRICTWRPPAISAPIS